MNTPTSKPMLSLAAYNQVLQLLVQAGQAAMSEYQQYLKTPELYQASTKTDNTPVTKADLLVNEILIKGLAAITPQISCVSEESCTANRPNTAWLIDPIDGTQQFLDQTGEFSINLALVHEHKAVLGFIVFVTDSCIYSQHPKQPNQVWVHDFKLNACRLEAPESYEFCVALSQRSKAAHEAHVSQWFVEQTGHAPDLKRAGSSFKFRMILEGKACAYVCPYPTSEWDTAAGQALIEAVGGKLVDAAGKPFRYLKRPTVKNASFLCLAPGFEPKAANELLSVSS